MPVGVQRFKKFTLETHLRITERHMPYVKTLLWICLHHRLLDTVLTGSARIDTLRTKQEI